jgi:hypothetical protein
MMKKAAQFAPHVSFAIFGPIRRNLLLELEVRCPRRGKAYLIREVELHGWALTRVALGRL